MVRDTPSSARDAFPILVAKPKICKMMPEMEQQQLSSSSSFSTPSNNNNSNGNGASSHAPFSSTIGSSSGVNGNGSTVAGAAATADAEAREWLAQREAKVERELYSGLQKRMDAQRKQVLAFKTEQTKWENKLQVRCVCGE